MADKYLKMMVKKHEAFKNYTLDFDYENMANFNKEVLIREITRMERIITMNMCLFSGVHAEFCEDEITEAERFYAETKIATLIEMGRINRCTYLYNEG